jgi:hypothetical protein
VKQGFEIPEHRHHNERFVADEIFSEQNVSCIRPHRHSAPGIAGHSIVAVARQPADRYRSAM